MYDTASQNTVKAFIQYFYRHQVIHLLDMVTENIILQSYLPQTIAFSGLYEGKNALVQHMLYRYETYAIEDIHIQHMVTQAGMVLTRGKTTIKLHNNPQHTELEWLIFCLLRGNMISTVEEFANPDPLLDHALKLK